MQSPLRSAPLSQDDAVVPVAEFSRRLANELSAAAEICRDCEALAAELSEGGASVSRLTHLQALDELGQRLAGLSSVLSRMGEQAGGDWSMPVDPLVQGLGLADLVVRLRTAEAKPAWDANPGELDLW